MDSQQRETVVRAMAGDGESFEHLVHDYSRLVFAHAFLIVRDRAESEDIVQETFVRAYSFRVRLREPEHIVPWLLAIARNLARDVLRRRARGPGDGGGAACPEPAAADPLPGADPADAWGHVEAVLADLPAHYRQALELRYLEGLDHRTMGERLSLPGGVLRGILNRALATLRQRLRRDGGPDGLPLRPNRSRRA